MKRQRRRPRQPVLHPTPLPEWKACEPGAPGAVALKQTRAATAPEAVIRFRPAAVARHRPSCAERGWSRIPVPAALQWRGERAKSPPAAAPVRSAAAKLQAQRTPQPLPVAMAAVVPPRPAESWAPAPLMAGGGISSAETSGIGSFAGGDAGGSVGGAFVAGSDRLSCMLLRPPTFYVPAGPEFAHTSVRTTLKIESWI